MNEFLSYVHDFDHSLFFMINHECVSPLLDQFFIFMTSAKNAFYFILVLFTYIFLRKPNVALTILLGCALAAGLADASATYLIKRNFHRDRPEFSAENVRLIVPSQGSPSFPSNHAANCVAVATYISYVLPEIALAVYGVALAVAYSRVYVGVHYPFDVVGGIILGFLCGVLAKVLMTYFNEGGEIPNAPAEPNPWKKRKRKRPRRNA